MSQEATLVKPQASNQMSSLQHESPCPSDSSSMRFNSVNRNVFFARHNPHPHRVCIMKGLWGSPICMVNDDPLTGGSHDAPALNFPPQDFLDYKVNLGSGSGNIPAGMINLAGPYRTLPNDTITALQYFTGMKNYSTRDKLVPHFGGSQVKENWRQELQTLTKSAVAPFLDRYLERQEQQANKYPDSRIQHPASWMNVGQPMCTSSRDGKTPLYSASGRIIPPSSRNLQSRRSRTAANIASLKSSGSTPIQSGQQRSATALMGEFGLTENMESEVFTMLCGILQTEDEHAIQSWLSGSSEREKALVISIIQSALANRQEYFNLNPEGTIRQVPDTAKNDFHLPPINESQDLEQQIIGSQGNANRLVIEDDQCENKENDDALPPPTSALFESSPAKAQQSVASGSTTQRSHQSELKKACEMKQKQKEEALKKEAKARATLSSNKTAPQTHRRVSGQSTKTGSGGDIDQSNITEGHSLLMGNIQKTWNPESSTVAGGKA